MAHFIRDYWHYSAPHSWPFWSMVTEVERDPKRRPVTTFATVLYSPSLPEHGRLIAESDADRLEILRIDDYAAELERGCRACGIAIDELEYDRLVLHLLDILNDGRGPMESEVIHE